MLSMIKANHKVGFIVIPSLNGFEKTSIIQKFLSQEWCKCMVYIHSCQVANENFREWNFEKAIWEATNYYIIWYKQCLCDKITAIFKTIFFVEDRINFLIRRKKVNLFISINHPSIYAYKIVKRVTKELHTCQIISCHTRFIENCNNIALSIVYLYIHDNSINNDEYTKYNTTSKNYFWK